MGRQVYEALPAARNLFDRAGKLLGYDLAKLCFEGPQEQLDSTVVSQPALFVTNLAVLESLRAEKPEVVESCSATAGLSLGEYSALVFAGVFSFEDGLRVVQERGAAMQDAADATPSGMVSILGLEPEEVLQLCEQAAEGDILQRANYLCPGNIAISGSRAACKRVEKLAIEKGAMKVSSLSVAGAVHTPIMESAVERVAAVLAEVTVQSPEIPVVMNVDGRIHEDPDQIRRLLARQVVEPVQWEGSMLQLLEMGMDEFYEVGPGRVLRGLLRRIQRKITCHTLG